MAEMLQFDWLEPRGMNDSTGTLGSVSWKALFIAKSRASDCKFKPFCFLNKEFEVR